jgi:hypothetical protein
MAAPRNVDLRGRATLSEDGLYRYTLHRILPSPVRWVRTVLFVMLNPSTADATIVDPTLATCLQFARVWGCTDLALGNLFAYRSTDWKACQRVADPVGPGNDAHLVALARSAVIIVCAWGSHAKEIHPLRARAVVKLLREATDVPLYALALNKDGAPRHPLYVPTTTDAVLFGETLGAVYPPETPRILCP